MGYDPRTPDGVTAMDDLELANRFERQRPQLSAVAYRMLGSLTEADDAVQESWLRLQRTDAEQIDNLEPWLTTVIARICLNILRSRRTRGEQPLNSFLPEPIIDNPVAGTDPEHEALLADAVGIALQVVLDTLSPAERLAFVLHDMFAVSYEEIAGILGKSPEACRQIASRARRRVRMTEDPTSDPQRQREIVDAFLAAAKTGDFQMLLSLLSPDVELVADAAAIGMGAPASLVGCNDVASRFSGGAKAARTALLDGLAGPVWSQGGTVKVAFDFTVVADKVTKIEMIAEHDVLGEIDIEVLRCGRDQ